jgi:hypothetical protein
VSTNLRVWFSGVVLVGGLAFVGSSWEGFDGRSPQSTEPRLLTEDYQVEMLTVPGTEDRFVFGMLPDLAARAEVHPLSGKAQVQVRTYVRRRPVRGRAGTWPSRFPQAENAPTCAGEPRWGEDGVRVVTEPGQDVGGVPDDAAGRSALQVSEHRAYPPMIVFAACG